jgi:hypothetical protein
MIELEELMNDLPDGAVYQIYNGIWHCWIDEDDYLSNAKAHYIQKVDETNKQFFTRICENEKVWELENERIGNISL